MRTTLLCLLTTLLIGSRSIAHEPMPVAPKEEHRPTPMPDRIILTWSKDPSVSQSVTWRTDSSVKKAMAQIAKAEANARFTKNAKTIDAKTQELTSDLSTANYHSVEFTDLKPKSQYLYRVGDGANWSEWFLFQTASDKPEPFQFVYFGDAQNEVKEHWSRVIREANKDAPRAAFLLHAGDLINNAHNDAQWGEWHRAGGWLNAMIPSVPTPGNHEYARSPGAPADEPKRELSDHWRPQFTLPSHGPAGLEETVYYLDYQGVRIVSLNSNVELEAQIEWLDKCLSNNPCKWTVLTFHHPIYSAARGRDNAKLRDLWQPVFDKHRVDIVLTGHDHTYARSGLMTYQQNVPTGAWVRGNKGTVYVTSVSGPKWYILEREEFMTRAAEETQLYQVIKFDGDTMLYESRTALGQLYDRFTLKKRPGQPNELIDSIPDVPENASPDRAAKIAAQDAQKKARSTAPKPAAAAPPPR